MKSSRLLYQAEAHSAMILELCSCLVAVVDLESF